MTFLSSNKARIRYIMFNWDKIMEMVFCVWSLPSGIKKHLYLPGFLSDDTEWFYRFIFEKD